MEPRISKAQLEVWEWKERAYESIKHLPLEEAIRVIHERTKDTVAEIERNRAMKKVAETQVLLRDLEQ